MSILLLGYDSEGIKEDFPFEKEGLRAITNVHRKHDVPATLFILGRALLSDVPFYQEALSLFPFDVESHTYSHCLLKDNPVPGYGGPAVSPDMIREEIPFMKYLLRKYLHATSNGLRAPVSYLDGLASKEEVLTILKAFGIHFVSSDATDSWQQFLTGEKSERQPYRYANGILEIPMHSLHDGVWKDTYGYGRLDEMTDYYLGELERFQGKIYAPVFHPWIMAKDDPEAMVLDQLITHAKKRGFEIMDYGQLWRKQEGLL